MTDRMIGHALRVSKKLFDTLFDEGLSKQSFIDMLQK